MPSPLPSSQVCAEVRAILRIEASELFRSSINRPNLFYEARRPLLLLICIVAPACVCAVAPCLFTFVPALFRGRCYPQRVCPFLGSRPPAAARSPGGVCTL